MRGMEEKGGQRHFRTQQLFRVVEIEVSEGASISHIGVHRLLNVLSRFPTGKRI